MRSDIFAEVCQAHIAFAQIGVMEGKGSTHVLRLMSHRGDMFQIVP